MNQSVAPEPVGDPATETRSDPESHVEQDDLLRTSARLLNAMAQAVVAWDLGGTITYVNDAAEAMYGWPRNVAVGAQVTAMSTAGISPELLAVIAETLEAGRTWTGEIAVDRADRTVVPVWLTTTPVVDDGATVGFVGVSLDISDRKAAEAQVLHRATHDGLTELANHRSLTEQLGERLAKLGHGESVSVVLVDIGSMDVTNDTFGHAMGEQLIAWGARRLAGAIHVGDLMARFSDHTFAVCCNHGITEAEALAYADRLRRRVDAENAAPDRPHIHLAIAAAVTTVTTPVTGAEDVLQTVATALTQAKRDGSTQVYDSSMRTALARRRQLEDVVGEAIASGQVTLGYQPVIDLDDGSTVGAEALLRMVDPEGSPLPAFEVVQAAERAGLMPEFGDLILRQACIDAAGWQQAIDDTSIIVSVNVSTTQLSDHRLPALVADALAESGLVPSALWLEITESTLMRDPVHCGDVLDELKALGVCLSADDFGTGYSSLAYLKRFPLDVVKIDQSFVSGLPDILEDFAIIQAILAMSDALGLTVVAEGVEREAQRTKLRGLGTHYAQGYLWSAAVPATVLLARLVTERSGPRDRPGTSVAVRPAHLVGDAPADGGSVLALLVREIRTPLTVITGYAAELERTSRADEARAAASIHRAAVRINRILTNLVATDPRGPGRDA